MDFSTTLYPPNPAAVCPLFVSKIFRLFVCLLFVGAIVENGRCQRYRTRNKTTQPEAEEDDDDDEDMDMDMDDSDQEDEEAPPPPPLPPGPPPPPQHGEVSYIGRCCSVHSHCCVRAVCVPVCACVRAFFFFFVLEL